MNAQRRRGCCTLVRRKYRTEDLGESPDNSRDDNAYGK